MSEQEKAEKNIASIDINKHINELNDQINNINQNNIFNMNDDADEN